MHLSVMEKFCDFFTLRPFDLNTTLIYVLMDNFHHCIYDIVNYYCMKRYQVKQKVIKDDFINNLIASCFDLFRLLIET